MTPPLNFTDKTWNKNDSILEEGEIVEKEEKNMEGKETRDEKEETCVMVMTEEEIKQQRRELKIQIEDTQHHIETCPDDDQREDLEKQMMVYMRLKEEISNGEEDIEEEMPMEDDEKEGSVQINGVEEDDDEENENIKMSDDEGSKEEEEKKDKDLNMEVERANDTSGPNIVQEVYTYQVKFNDEKLGLEVAKGTKRLVWVTKVNNDKLKKKIQINDIIISVNNEQVDNDLKFIQSTIRPITN